MRSPITSLFIVLGILSISVPVVTAGCSTSGSLTGPLPLAGISAPSTPASTLFNHVSIVMMENHNYDQIIGNRQAPYINRLARENALFTNSHAISHPSEPNYLALYSGSRHDVTSDDCPLSFSGSSLGGELIHAGKSVTGYMEGLPSVGWRGCSSGEYWRKHNPLIDFTDTPASDVVPFSELTGDLSAGYPSLAFIVPNELNDMHDGTIAEGDAWLAVHIPAIIAYDATHNGLLIVTWDENADAEPSNQIPTIFIGPMVRPGRYDQSIDHYNVLRTITNDFSLSPLTGASGISGVWR